MRKMFTKNEIEKISKEVALNKPNLINFGELDENDVFILENEFNLKSNQHYLITLYDNDEDASQSFIVYAKTNDCIIYQPYNNSISAIDFDLLEINIANKTIISASLAGSTKFTIIEIYEI